MVAAATSEPTSARITAVEKRISALEAASVKAKDDAADARMSFLSCVSDAEAEYWNYIRLNGWKKAGSDPANPIWKAPMVVWNQAATDKRNAIEICKATWKKGD